MASDLNFRFSSKFGQFFPVLVTICLDFAFFLLIVSVPCSFTDHDQPSTVEIFPSLPVERFR